MLGEKANDDSVIFQLIRCFMFDVERVFGSLDPMSGTATLLEVSRVLSNLKNTQGILFFFLTYYLFILKILF